MKPRRTRYRPTAAEVQAALDLMQASRRNFPHGDTHARTLNGRTSCGLSAPEVVSVSHLEFLQRTQDANLDGLCAACYQAIQQNPE